MEHLNVTAENKKKGLTPAGKYGNLFKVIEKTKQSVHSHRSTKGDYRLIKFKDRGVCFKETIIRWTVMLSTFFWSMREQRWYTH